MAANNPSTRLLAHLDELEPIYRAKSGKTLYVERKIPGGPLRLVTATADSRDGTNPSLLASGTYEEIRMFLNGLDEGLHTRRR